MARVPYILPAAVVVGLGAGAALAPPMPAQSHTNVPSGGIIGRVIDQQSQLPLGGATVSLLGTPRQTATDSSGRFTQAELGPGTYLIEVRAIGYGVNSWILKLKDGEVVDYTFEIAQLSVDLDPVTVEGRPALAERRLREFEERRRGGRGVFITQDQIKTSHAATMSSTPALPVVGIVGIEIYRSPGEAPAEFLKADSQCGVIAIWTKSGP